MQRSRGASTGPCRHVHRPSTYVAHDGSAAHAERRDFAPGLLEAYGELVDELRALVSGDEYEHWLFVFGSILVQWEGSSTQTGQGGNEKLVNNVVLIQKGGGGRDARVVVKEHKSPIDFIGSPSFPVDALAQGEVSHPRPGKKKWLFESSNRGSGRELQEKDYQAYEGLGIFEEDDITFGVEVCLDHARRRLRLSPPARGQSMLQVQLIPSAGMRIMEQATVAIRDGIVFCCDGNKRSEVRVVERACSGKNSDAVLAAAGVPELDRLDVHDGNTKKVFERMFSGRGGAEIVVYGAQRLPSKSQRTSLTKPYSARSSVLET